MRIRWGWIVLIFWAALLLGMPVWAQTPPRSPAANGVAKPPAAASASAVNGVTPAQAQQTLEILKDDKRRAALIATLETVTKAAAATPDAGAAVAAVPAPGPVTAEPGSPLPLEPDSLGVQFVSQLGNAVSRVGAQFVASVQSVNDLPLLWRWAVGQVTNPVSRDRLLDTAWKLLVVLAIGVAAEWGARFAVRSIRIRVSQSLLLQKDKKVTAGAAAMPPLPGEGKFHGARFATMSGVFRRLPLQILRLVLSVLPIGVFWVVGTFLLGTPLGDPDTTRGAGHSVMTAYVAAGLTLAIADFLACEAAPQLRLLPLSGWAAGFVTRWTRRITIVAAVGYAVAEIGLRFGMYRTAYDSLLKIFALVVHGCLLAAVLQVREPVARRIRAKPGSSGPWAATLNRLADVWHLVAMFYIIALWLVWAIELRDGYSRLIHFFLVTAAVLVAARILWLGVLAVLERLRAVSLAAARFPWLKVRADAYFPALRGLLLTCLRILTLLALLEVWGFDVVTWFAVTGLGGRTVSALVQIGFTVLLAVLVWEGANTAIEIHISRLSHSAQMAKAGRLRTLLPMLRTVLLVTILLIVVLTVLSELGVNIAPLLAGAGVIGIAVGLGSQKLVQDFITGLFLLFENAMQVGDVVTLGGLSGTVEALSIRTIRLRSVDGSVHLIPFSAVTTVTNQTRDYGFAVLDVSIGLNEEPDRIVDVLKGVAEAMRAEPRWQPLILEPLDIMGVEKFIEFAWVMRVRLKTQPSSRWAVSRELNRRIKIRFDELAIESPFTSYRALNNTATGSASDDAFVEQPS